MKSARIFLIGMYVHLLLSILVPIGAAVAGTKGLKLLVVLQIILYCIMLAAVHIAGWVCAGMSIKAYKKGENDELKKATRLLKLGSIPFYIINGVYVFLILFLILVASRGTLVFMVLFFLPIPVIFTCLLIVESGVSGICYVMWLRKHPQDEKRPWAVHYFFQLISLLDVISTIVLLIRYRKRKNI